MLTKKYRLVFGMVLMMAGILSACSSTANTTNSGNEQQAQKLAQRTIGKLNKQKKFTSDTKLAGQINDNEQKA